jgi:hypothetical protein
MRRACRDWLSSVGMRMGMRASIPLCRNEKASSSKTSGKLFHFRQFVLGTQNFPLRQNNSLPFVAPQQHQQKKRP